MRHEYVEYAYKGITYKDSYYLPDNVDKPLPVVMVVPDYHGATEYAEKDSQAMCALGYVACCIDLYGNRAMPKTGPDATQMIKKAQIRSDVDESRTAVIGYSSGGMLALDMARRIPDLRGAILEWGVALPWQLRPLPMIEPHVGNAKVLILQGTDDPFNPLEAVTAVIREFDASATDYQWMLFGQKKHAFSLKAEDNLEIRSGEAPTALLYDAEATRRADKYISYFLEEVFE
jgi:dienelactone hydrolase